MSEWIESMRRVKLLLPFAFCLSVAAASLTARADYLGPDDPTVPWLSVKDGAFVGAHEVYWGGFHIGSVESETEIGSDAYLLRFDFRTEGVLSWFLDGRSTVLARGVIDEDGAIVSREMLSQGVWNGQSRRLQTLFDERGRLASFTVDPEEEDLREPAPDNLRVGPDPLSLIVAASLDPHGFRNAGMTGGYAEDGSRILHAFDGKRAMEFSWRCRDDEEFIEAIGVSAYAGPALRCFVNGHQTGGFHKVYSKRNLLLDRDATLWLAPSLMDDFFIPVRLHMRTNYGDIVAHLVRVGPPTAQN